MRRFPLVRGSPLTNVLPGRRPELQFGRSLLSAAAAAPFIPSAWQFLRLGVPDLLYSGDGAVLELGTLHASHGAQLLGPYSRFEWSHPGPLFFYLAVPVYEGLGRNGPALNLFALLANLVTAIAIVLTACRLRGELFALVVAALLAVYEVVGLPFLLANSWNPVFPILPLALLSFLAVLLASRNSTAVPLFAFVASLIVQTHIALAPAVVAMSAFVVVSRRRRAEGPSASPPDRTSRWTWLITAAVLTACWSLPLYEAATESPGNIQQLIAFFAPDNLGEHGWGVALSTVADQMALMSLAIARTVLIPVRTPGWPVVLALSGVLFVAVGAIFVVSILQGDAVLRTFAAVSLVQMAAAILAVRGIRGEIAFHLVIWISLLGFMAWVTFAAWLVQVFQGTKNGRIAIGLGSAVLLGLVFAAPRAPVFGPADAGVENLARTVETYLRSTPPGRRTIRIPSRETWPTAVAVILYLHKRDIPISVESAWLHMVGKPFAESPGRHPGLLFGNAGFSESARARRDLTFVAMSGDVYVYYEDADSRER